MTYFLKVKSLGWPSEGPMVLPLILSLRFLIKEKEKKLFHKTFKTFFLLLSLTVGNMPTGSAAQLLLLPFYPWLAPLDGKTFQRRETLHP